MEIPNTYSGLIDDWKIALIDQRARLRGFRVDELPEVRQEIVLELCRFQYDPERGASERTALISWIDRSLLMLLRTRARRQAHEVVCAEFVDEEGVADDCVDPHRVQDLRNDLAPVLASLDPVEREICAGLAHGDSLRALSETLRLSRYEICRTIDRIRARFTAGGLRAWVVG
jgi:hypothetical protein